MRPEPERVGVPPASPRSLFARTTLIIAAALIAYFLLTWLALVWAVVVPAASSTGHLLADRANEVIRSPPGTPPPEGTFWEISPGPPPARRLAGVALSYYLDLVTREVSHEVPGSRIVITRAAGPSELWLLPPGSDDRWIRMTWTIIRPEAPIAAILALGVGALVVVGAASISARRLARPLAALTVAAAKLADGHPMQVDTNTGPSEVRALAVAFDAMSRRLSELESERELMLAGVSHDLRSPLTRIRLAIELLDGRDSRLAHEMTRDIEEMDRMVGQFLRYVRANYREPPVAAVPDQVVRSGLESYRGNDALSLQLAAPANCRLPQNALRHIVVNLVENALNYGKPPIVVRTRREDDWLVLGVDDHGPGLTAEGWSEARRPFQRLRQTENTGHTGLGLALVERLVAGCEGRWTATKTDLGFSVEVRIPVDPSLAT